jgi:phycocyanin-associated rod linker protein
MTPLAALALRIEPFAPTRSAGRRQAWSAFDSDAILCAAYQQVLGQQHVMERGRLIGVGSLFRHGDLSARDLVRAIAQSDLYRTRFFQHL